MKYGNLIAEQFAEGILGFLFTRQIAFGAFDFFKIAAGKIEVFAIIVAVLFIHRLSPAFAALVGHNHIVVDAVTAAAQVRVALIAGIPPARQVR